MSRVYTHTSHHASAFVCVYHSLYRTEYLPLSLSLSLSFSLYLSIYLSIYLSCSFLCPCVIPSRDLRDCLPVRLSASHVHTCKYTLTIRRHETLMRLHVCEFLSPKGLLPSSRVVDNNETNVTIIYYVYREGERCIAMRAWCTRRAPRWTWTDDHSRVPMHNPLRTLRPHDTYRGWNSDTHAIAASPRQHHVGYARHVIFSK